MVDPAGDRAVFKQIADRLRERIESGDLKVGDQIPSEAQLCRIHTVSRATARQAIAVLVTEGLVVPEHGRGVFVAPSGTITVVYWRRLAQRLAVRLARHAYCSAHPDPAQPDQQCERCRDRAAYLAFTTRRHGGAR